MAARILDGRQVAAAVWERVQAEAARLRQARGRPPCLAIVRSDDEAAQAYQRQIERAFARHGLAVVLRDPPQDAGAARAVLTELSRDDDVDGVLLMAPLAGDVDARAVIPALGPGKDVDGQHPANLGLLVQRRSRFVPSTALGGLRLLQHYGVALRGRRAVIVGRSAVVGLPLSLLLLDADATVTVCHTRTDDLPGVTREADILCVAAGRPGLVGREGVKTGAVVVDFGTSPGPGGALVGDVRTAEVAEVAAAVTPVPGGVGAVTVAVLAGQTVAAARARPGEAG